MLIDKDQILSEYGEDFDIFMEFFESYAEQSDDFIANIESAAVAKDAKALGLHAHTLKGMVVNFYSEQIKDQLINIEQMAKNGDLSEAQALIQSLKELNNQLIIELRNFINETNG